MHDGLGNFEFVELYNYGPAPVDLTQWSLENSSGSRFDISQELMLSPGQCAILCRDLSSFTNFYFTGAPALGNLPFDLSNRRDALTLRAWDGQIVDRVSYEDTAPWPVRADGDGATLERLSPTGAGSTATNWAPSPGGGSPGAPNGPSAPAILALWHDPPVPSPSHPVTIFARSTNLPNHCLPVP
ncbi:MAG: lamin tail domain-containing protein [bacterium]|nr:lamin tail domain-containing protein [bacterium]